jgi:hypothetical protein
MRHPLATALETLGLLLMPGLALGFLVWLIAELLPTFHAAVAAIADLQLWAQLYLVLVLGVVIGAPCAVVALGAARREQDELELVLPGLRDGGR